MGNASTAFRKRLRQFREEAGLSQAVLASKVGLDPTAITKIERGNRAISLDEACALAIALGRTLSEMTTVMALVSDCSGLQACKRCGAMTSEASRELHAAWHLRNGDSPP